MALPLFTPAKTVGIRGCLLDARKSMRFLARQQRDLQIRCTGSVLAGNSSGAGMALRVGLRSMSPESLALELQGSGIDCIGGRTTCILETIGEILGSGEIAPRKNENEIGI